MIEPFGPPVDNFRIGQVCATVANFSMMSKKHNFVPDDFFPRQRTREETASEPKTLSNKILGFFKGLKAKVG